MPAMTSPTTRRPVSARMVSLLIAVTCCIVLVAAMARLVLHEIDELSTANSDNLQWNLAQADVELLQFQLALERASAGSGTLDMLRRRFDVFYSRMSMLEEGEIYWSLRENWEFDTPRVGIKAFLDEAVPLIDGPDEGLRAALPLLVDRSNGIAEIVRAFSLSGLAAYADLSDSRREELVRTLVLLAAVLAALFAGLVMLAVSLFRLARLAEGRAHEVQATAARLRTVVETSLDAIVVTDRAGMIREFNPAAQQIFGYGRDQVRGRRLIDLMVPQEAADALRGGRMGFLEAGRRPEPKERRFELSVVDSSGRSFPAEVSVDSADSDGDRVYVAFIRDISRRKAAEEGLTEARDRALAGERAKAEFVAVMSHEMRTPLNGLLGSIQLMRGQLLTDRQGDLLDRMDFCGRLLLGLINDVLDLAKLEAGKQSSERRPFSVKRLLDGVVETTSAQAAANGNALAWRWVGEQHDGAEGDLRQLRQVLLNLVGNAVKFTQGGRVDIEVELLGTDRSTAEFRVIDTGPGIAEGDLERIFDDFETLDSSYARQAGGTGLGLGIARRLARLMGGEIGAESEPGEGSLFWLRLPVGRPVQVPSAELDAPARTHAVSRPLDLLLVEDNQINRYVARQMLEAEGHRVTEAVNGRAGVEWAEAKAFDAILMDISMPVMDGTEAARMIRAGHGASARSPVIAVTAHALPEEVARFREAGMAHCISKPIDPAALLDVLARIADGRLPSSASEEEGEEAILAKDHLRSLWSGIPAGERDCLLDRCLTEMEEGIALLAAAPPKAPPLVSIAHRCAGTCGTFGLVALRAELARIETRWKRDEPVRLDQLQALADLWRRSREALTTCLAAA